MRFCCAVLKESAGVGWLTLIGVRHAESVKRSKRNEMEIMNRKFSGSFDEFEIRQETTQGCYKGRDKLVLAPIIQWTDHDVWNFIRDNGIEYCRLYDEGRHRIGCLFCPMSSIKNIRRDEQKYPKYKAAIIRTIDWLLTNTRYANKFVKKYNATPEEVYEAWVSKKSFDKYFADLRYQQRIRF